MFFGFIWARLWEFGHFLADSDNVRFEVLIFQPFWSNCLKTVEIWKLCIIGGSSKLVFSRCPHSSACRGVKPVFSRFPVRIRQVPIPFSEAWKACDFPWGSDVGWDLGWDSRRIWDLNSSVRYIIGGFQASQGGSPSTVPERFRNQSHPTCGETLPYLWGDLI